MRTVLLALVIALGGGTHLLGNLAELFIVQADGTSSDAGSRFDPDGLTTTGGSNADDEAGSRFDPNG